MVRSGVGRTADGKRVQIGRQASRTFGMSLGLVPKSAQWWVDQDDTFVPASLPRRKPSSIFSDILNPRAVVRVGQRGEEKKRYGAMYQMEVGNWAMKRRCKTLNK